MPLLIIGLLALAAGVAYVVTRPAPTSGTGPGTLRAKIPPMTIPVSGAPRSTDPHPTVTAKPLVTAAQLHNLLNSALDQYKVTTYYPAHIGTLELMPGDLVTTIRDDERDTDIPILWSNHVRERQVTISQFFAHDFTSRPAKPTGGGGGKIQLFRRSNGMAYDSLTAVNLDPSGFPSVLGREWIMRDWGWRGPGPEDPWPDWLLHRPWAYDIQNLTPELGSVIYFGDEFRALRDFAYEVAGIHYRFAVFDAEDARRPGLTRAVQAMSRSLDEAAIARRAVIKIVWDTVSKMIQIVGSIFGAGGIGAAVGEAVTEALARVAHEVAHLTPTLLSMVRNVYTAISQVIRTVRETIDTAGHLIVTTVNNSFIKPIYDDLRVLDKVQDDIRAALYEIKASIPMPPADVYLAINDAKARFAEYEGSAEMIGYTRYMVNRAINEFRFSKWHLKRLDQYIVVGA